MYNYFQKNRWWQTRNSHSWPFTNGNSFDISPSHGVLPYMGFSHSLLEENGTIWGHVERGFNLVCLIKNIWTWTKLSTNPEVTLVDMKYSWGDTERYQTSHQYSDSPGTSCLWNRLGLSTNLRLPSLCSRLRICAACEGAACTACALWGDPHLRALMQGWESPLFQPSFFLLVLSPCPLLLFLLCTTNYKNKTSIGEEKDTNKSVLIFVLSVILLNSHSIFLLKNERCHDRVLLLLCSDVAAKPITTFYAALSIRLVTCEMISPSSVHINQ